VALYFQKKYFAGAKEGLLEVCGVKTAGCEKK
jgi:hypothetical protein